MPNPKKLLVLSSFTVSALAGCSGPSSSAADAGVAAPATNLLPRAEFNRLAAELALPLFWSEDRDGDASIDPDEVDVVWGLSREPRRSWVTAQGFTTRFIEAYAAVRARHEAAGDALAELPASERQRRELLRRDLRQGRPSLVTSDFTNGSAEDRAVVAHLLAAAEHVERIYRKQVGSFAMEAQIPAEDTLSRLHFFLNQGPWCSAPATESEPLCSALPERPAEISGLYPARIQQDPSFCDKLQEHPDHEQLLAPFTAVTEQSDGRLTAVPYDVYFAEDMKAVAEALTAAADAIEDPREAAFQTYLRTAAKAFLDNDWFAADEAWAKMNADNSKWYLRVGPDEVYFEPCSRKAGFHMSFARINPASKEWQSKLTPLRADMEKALAALAGPPYQAREVSFQLPDFIDVVLNAGDSRGPRGATIGQSLPNWGPVANEGRGRTVAMTNLYTDADSKAAQRAQAESLLCPEVMSAYTDDAAPQLMTTVLHEAAHNLGPAHQYRVKGKTDDEVFGGPMASTLEELKAQTAALYYTDWLVEKGVIDRGAADRAHLRDMTWAFGHVSRGLYTSDGKPKPYSQLAAIQVGFLLREGALRWNAEATAANGKDQGCFAVRFDELPAAVKKLSTEVFGIKARGDVARARELVAQLVDAEGSWQELRAVITERWQRWPQASFLYAVRLE